MKRIIAIAFFLCLLIPAMAQVSVTISGTISNIANGNPIPSCPVTIYSDSATGFFYYNTVYTNSNGYYTDTFTSGTNWGVMFVRVIDCNQVMYQDTCNYAAGNTSFIKNFSICFNTPPNCDASFSYYPTVPLSIQFNDLSAGSPTSWSWSFGDGGSSNTQNPLHTYAYAGTYTVILSTGNPSTGCFDSTFQTIVVTDSTGGGCEADFYPVADSINPQIVHFYNTSTVTGTVGYLWDFGDPASGQNNTSLAEDPTHHFTAPGTYHVALTVMSNDSNCYDVTYHIIQVNSGGANCQAQFSYYPDSTPAQGYLYHFLDLSLGLPVSWYWDFGDSLGTSTLQNPTYAYTSPGLYYVCLTIQCQGVTSTWCQTVFVQGTIDCSSYFTFQQNNLSVSFSGHMVYPQPAIYVWNFGDGQSGTGESVVHTYANPGMYFVTLTTTTTDSLNCTYSSGQTIQVGDTNLFNQVYGQVFMGGIPVEAGLAMIISTDTAPAYIPFMDVRAIDSLGVYIFPYVPEGNFVVLAIPFDTSGYLPTYYGDVILWEEATVISLGDPSNPYNINLVPGQYLPWGPGIIHGQVSSTGLKSGMTDKIIMILMDMQGNSITFDAVDETGSFGFGSVPLGTYHLHAELAGVTSDKVTVALTESEPSANVFLTFTGNRILGTDETLSPVGPWQIYPNPFREGFSVTLRAAMETNLLLEVFDLTGNKVVSLPVNTARGVNTFTVNLPHLHTGLYTIRITTPEGIRYFRKIVRIR